MDLLGIVKANMYPGNLCYMVGGGQGEGNQLSYNPPLPFLPYPEGRTSPFPLPVNAVSVSSALPP